MNKTLYFVGMALIMIGAISVLIVPVVASVYLYWRERRVVFFKFVSHKKEAGESELENRLASICSAFEALANVCMFLFVGLILYEAAFFVMR